MQPCSFTDESFLYALRFMTGTSWLKSVICTEGDKLLVRMISKQMLCFLKLNSKTCKVPIVSGEIS